MASTVKKRHVVNVICSQCGQPWDRPACGPTHALIAREIEDGVTVAKPREAAPPFRSRGKDKARR